MKRGSCCLGLPPCSSTQNMALCGAHESLWHCEQSEVEGGGSGRGRGGVGLGWFSWATEGRWEGCSWLPERSPLSSTQARMSTRTGEHAMSVKSDEDQDSAFFLSFFFFLF